MLCCANITFRNELYAHQDYCAPTFLRTSSADIIRHFLHQLASLLQLISDLPNDVNDQITLYM